ncbi:MAG: tetratricopeptide repeat protein [Bacteroidales bacterium]|nr:tetratricopeptide repeat protein [Bacteroidales bacterium]
MKKVLTAILCLFVLGANAHAQYDKDVFMWRGRQALQDGKYAGAIEQFNILERLDSTNYWNFFFRGIAKYNLGDLRGAKADFNTSVRLNPVFTNGYHYRAITESRTGQYEEAFADLEHAIRLRPGHTALYYSRGVTYFLARRFDEAVQDFNRYIKKEPKAPSAYLNRGATYLYLKDTTRALADYDRAIRLDRFEPEGYVRRGRVYAARAQYDLGITDMDRAIDLDSTNTFAYFNRALMHYELQDYNAAVSDLDRVLRFEPGNALTLYNRSLIRAQMRDFEGALADMDRVIAINPGNVLAYFNRASIFVETERWADALEDYDKAIELYPDFAKAYLNRSYVENRMGRKRASKADYETAQQKVREYRERSASDPSSFANTTRKYSGLLALDADFAKKDFDDELLQHRDIDIRLRPLYRFRLSTHRDAGRTALSQRYEHPVAEHFMAGIPVGVTVSNADNPEEPRFERSLSSLLAGDSAASAGSNPLPASEADFIRGLYEVQNKQYSAGLDFFDRAAAKAGADSGKDRYAPYYKAFYLMNRGVLRAEMIDFIASIESNVQTLTMDENGAARARVSERTDRSYDYSEAIADISAAIAILPDLPWLHYDLGNLRCLSAQLVDAIGAYGKAIELNPQMGDAYFNRGLVLIFLKDKEKGCIDLSRAGALGVGDAYSVIARYCKEEENL